jgi:hypothetical protein
MKKQAKKLTLAKETVRNLGAPGLRQVAGATALQTDCQTACTQPADTFSCGSCVGCNPSITCDCQEPAPVHGTIVVCGI